MIPGCRTTSGSLHVLHCSAGNLYGGTETFLRTLAQTSTLRPGLAHEFALCFEGQAAAELRREGAEVHLLGAVRFSRPWTCWRARARLARVLVDRQVDVVVAHGCWPYLLVARTARRAGRPMVFWAHDLMSGRHPLERRAARTSPDLAIANSHATAAALTNVFPNVRAEVVRCPVRPPDAAVDRAAVRAELDTPEGNTVIMTACRLERWKGHGLLLDALGRLRDVPGWTAWVAGGAQRPHEREYLEELLEQARGAGVSDRVRFLGQRGDVTRLMAAADIHCQPNTGPEPFGIAFVEALYAGLPVVTTRLGGAQEVVTDACGVLVPPGDAGALASALASLMADPGTRRRLGAAGPARAALLCDPGQVLERLEGLLAGLRAGAGKVEAAS
jgi:glycosyltransferase involved in cell wall biosynthesis